MKYRNALGIVLVATAATLQGAACSDDAATAPLAPDVGAAGGGGRDGGGDAGRGDASSDGGARAPDGAQATFAVLETTDIHTNILSYDYFKLLEDKTIGLERAATLITQARQEFPSSVLVDNGDTIQGTVVADVQALVQPVACSQALAVYKAMNAIGFDVGGIGNHEFNYGLAYLSQVTHTPFDVDGVSTVGNAACAGPAFPQVLANVFSTKTNQPIFHPSTIVTKTIDAIAPGGASIHAQLKIGFLAFTPPPIVNWDKRWLDGKVYTKGVNEVAAGVVADLRAKGADLVVAIIHGGINADVDTSVTPAKITPTAYTADLESQSYYLAQVPGIDAMLMGHSHLVFPNAVATNPGFNVQGVDKDAGSVNGVPSVMANFWGQHLGVIKLGLTAANGKWTIDKSQTMVEARPISTTCAGGVAVGCSTDGKWRTGGVCAFATACAGKADKTRVYVDADPTIAPLVDAEHQATIAYVKTPIGTTDFEMSSYFAEVGDGTAVQIVNQAQADYVTNYVRANLPQYAALPVLSVSAPFKSGFQGGNDYTDVAAGNVAINNAADLYLYANTIYAVKVTGQTILDWLETSATRFAQIDPKNAADQDLLNPGQPGYNFDLFTSPDISYAVDVTQPLPSAGSKASGRIKNLQYQGAPIDLAAEFIVATNNYRASGGGGFPGLDGSKTIYAAPDTNRDVLIAYIGKTKNLTRAANGAARSWHFAKVATAGRVILHAAQNKLPLATAAGILNVSVAKDDDGSGKGLSSYAIDLDNP